MSIALTVPEGFQYIGASLLSTVFVLVGQSVAVGKWRKRSGIQYPQLYAEKAEAAASNDARIFNCAQRAHQNTLENLPIIYTTTILTGLRYPILAASACGLWSFGRIFYTRGYLTGKPANRTNPLGLLSTLSLLGLLLTSTYTVGQLIMENL